MRMSKATLNEEQFLLEQIQECLHQHGYKMTPQRKEIIEVLLHSQEHLSAEDVYSLLRLQKKNIGLATVYRTMELLYEIKVIDKVSFGDQTIRYEWKKESLSHAHHHLFCTGCGKIIELDDDLLAPLRPQIADQYHFFLDDHPLALYGLCEACQKRGLEK